jgi:hypothetical protein
MPKFICQKCNTSKETETAYNRHIALCKFLSISAKERIRQLDEYEKEPSIREIFQVVISLCEENNILKKRLDKLELSNHQYKKKTIEDYLSSLPVQEIITFSEWTRSIIVTDHHFQILLDKNLTECIKKMIMDAIDTIDITRIPLKAFSQRNNQFYKYDDLKWVQLKPDELKSLISILNQRIIKKYMDWKTKHKDEIDRNTTMQDLDMQYMTKTIGFGKSIESRISEIRKYIFDKIKENIKDLE